MIMKKQKLSRNFIYQFLYQIIILIIPLILSPYLTRTLGDTALGIYAYANSVAFYFVEFAMLGIAKYGQRLIAKNAENQQKLRESFWSLFAIHLIVSVLSLTCYLFFSGVFVQSDRVIFVIEAIYVASALFDITWLFYGLENFKKVVLRNAVVKITELLLIFYLVKSPSDLWIYTLISSLGIFIGQIVLIPSAIKSIPPIKFDIKTMLLHFKPMLVLSVSVIAVSLYTVFDKTLLGLLTTKENVAYYEYSNKIVNIPKTFVSVIGTVMFPRACVFVANKDIQNQKKYIYYSLLLTGFIGMASIFGLLGVSNLFVNIYYGPSFSQCASIIIGLSPLVIIIGIGDIIRTQYMIPNEMDRQYILCSIYNAIVNIVLSLFFIITLPAEYKILGAVIGTVSAELFGCTYQFIICRGFIKAKDIVSALFPFAIIGGIMFCVLKVMATYMSNTAFSLIIQMIFGGVVYLFLSLIYFSLFQKPILFKILEKIKTKRRS